jgi:hypothetical protein
MNLPPLPNHWGLVHMWDGPSGFRRSFQYGTYNGDRPTSSVAVFTAQQMQAYATAAVLAERKRLQDELHQLDEELASWLSNEDTKREPE